MSYLNKHYLFQFCKYLVIVLSLKTARCELQSPCPNVFEYRYDGANNLYGFVQVPSPNDNSNIIRLEVQLSVGNSVQGFNGNIELTNPRSRVIEDLSNKKPLQYNVYFPYWSNIAPKITKILVNGNQVCYGYPIDRNIVSILTTINLEHTLTISTRLSSGSDWKPGAYPNDNGFQKRRGSYPENNVPQRRPGYQDFPFADDADAVTPQISYYFTNKPNNVRSPINFNLQQPNSPVTPSQAYPTNPFLNQENKFNINNNQNSQNSGFLPYPENNFQPVYYNYYPNTSSNTPSLYNPFLPNNQNNGFDMTPNKFSFDDNFNYNPQNHFTTTTTSTTSRPRIVTQVPPTQLPRDGAIDDLPTVENNLIQKPFSDVCGISINANALLVNANRVAKKLHPWLAALFMQNNESLKFICGTSLISQKHVVTAAHCVKNRKRKLKPEELWIALGRENIHRWSNDGAQIVQAESTHVHPEYQFNTADADIAVIVLSEEAVFSRIIRPICLWTGTTDVNLIVGNTGIIAGWGKDETGRSSTPEPREITFPIVSEEECLRSNTAFREITSNRTLCGGYRNDSGPCNGDSGSGFIMQINGRWTLRGFVSMSLGSNGKCDLSQYVVLTDVAKHLDWLLSFLR